MTTPKCSRCLSAPAKPDQRWCKACFAKYMRAYRAKRITVTRETFGRLSKAA
jgi:hypothetical protein